MTDNENVSGIRAGDGDAAGAQQVLTGVDALDYQAQRAREEGRYEDALHHLLAAFALAMAENQKQHVSVWHTMLEWQFLVELFAPARETLIRTRDAQASRVLAGDVVYGVPYSEYSPQPSRFQLVVHMNETLEDPRATYELFVELAARMPDEARRVSFLALPAVVEAGDFALGERYLPDPLGFLGEMNRSVREWPLSPFTPSSMRSFADLSNFAKDLRLRAAIVRGMGRAAEADALLEAGLAGMATDEMRDWVSKDLASPGAILRLASAQHMAFEVVRTPRTPEH